MLVRPPFISFVVYRFISIIARGGHLGHKLETSESLTHPPTLIPVISLKWMTDIDNFGRAHKNAVVGRCIGATVNGRCHGTLTTETGKAYRSNETGETYQSKGRKGEKGGGLFGILFGLSDAEQNQMKRLFRTKD